MRLVGRRIPAVLAVLAGLAGTLAAGAPSRAAAAAAGAAPPMPLPGSAAPRLPARAVRLGALPGGTVIHLDVTLNLPDQARLSAFLADLSDRESPLFHHFLRPGQFGPEFGPSLAQVEAVENALRAAGLSPGSVSASRLAIGVNASAAAIDRAFGIQLINYRLPSGRTAYANSAAPELPATVAPLVTGVLGLNDLYPQQSQVNWPSAPTAHGPQAPVRPLPHAARGAAGPTPCAAAAQTGQGLGAYTADQFANYYGMTPLYGMGDLGQGVRVAIIELEPNLPSDINAYLSCYGIHTTVNYVQVDGGVGSGAGSGEAALDIEDVAGLAPGATIDVYQVPNDDSYDGYAAIANDDKDAVVSSSWGLCEAYITPAYLDSEQVVFEKAASQGQTVFAAAGDWGSTSCLPDGGPDAADLSPWDPASQPYVVGVGGTTITPTGDTVWNESALQGGAGGGGLSSWCMPDYQYQRSIPGLINGNSTISTVCPPGTGRYLRQVPDVSADADPFTGYVLMFSGSWGSIGGTSAAAPLWAAIAALIDASPFCADYGSGRAGVLPAGLYAAVAADHAAIYPSSSSQIPEALSDVTTGNNDYTPSGYTGGLYPAGKGFDEATGLGEPRVSGLDGSGSPSTFYPGLAALMCRVYATKLTSVQVTGVTPSAGPAGKVATVTVHGSGFLPIAGADKALIGSTLLPANCTSTTACTVTLPAKAAGTINIQVTAEDFTPSPVTTADRYTYVAAPAITSLAPVRAPAAGGTTVTIHGANFTGVTAVHFGSKAGTKIKVVSAAEITVTAPAGSGTVHVTVTAVGGTSSTTAAASKYTYT
jgi:Pro-kumamolisin, activation domain/IPT/TIG domain/Subtilase family